MRHCIDWTDIFIGLRECNVLILDFSDIIGILSKCRSKSPNFGFFRIQMYRYPIKMPFKIVVQYLFWPEVLSNFLSRHVDWPILSRSDDRTFNSSAWGTSPIDFMIAPGLMAYWPRDQMFSLLFRPDVDNRNLVQVSSCRLWDLINKSPPRNRAGLRLLS